MSAASCFNIYINGQIEVASFPLGPSVSEMFCRYEFVAGQDWELLSGMKRGVTQHAIKNKSSNDVVFNMPLELTYKSTSVFGWPQILICIYGKTFWGVETVLGYCRAHVPVFGSPAEQCNVKAAILAPKCTSTMSELTGWITGKNPELKNPKILLDNTKQNGLLMESLGCIKMTFNTIASGTEKLGFDWG